MNELLVIWAFIIHSIMMAYHFLLVVDDCFSKKFRYKVIAPYGNELWVKGIDINGVAFTEQVPKINATWQDIVDAITDFHAWDYDVTKAYYYEIQYPDGDMMFMIAEFPCQFSEIPD